MRTPKYRKHSSRDCGFVEWQGKRHYLPGEYNSPQSREAYRQFLSQQVFGATLPPELSATLGMPELVAGFLQYANRHYPTVNGKGQYVNLKSCLRPLAAHYPTLRAADFGPLKLKEWRAKLVEDSKHSRPYINQQVAKIKLMFRWAVSEELLPATSYEALRTLLPLQCGRTTAAEPPKRQAVKWDDVEAIFPYVSAEIRDMILVQWHTGARAGSVCRAKPKQFRKDGELLLWTPRHKTEYRGDVLVIPIGPRCRAVLAPYLAKPPDEYLFDPREQRNSKRYGRHYTTQTYRQAIERGIERANEVRAKSKLEPLPNWTPHQLRHSKGEGVRQKHGIEAVQAVLGQKALKASEVYSNRRLDVAKEIAESEG